MSIFKGYLPYYKRNLKVAAPIMLSQAGQVLVQQVDNMMVGMVGTTELAAAAFANSVFVIAMIFGMGFCFGLTPLVGHTVAKNDKFAAGELLNNSLNANLLIAVLLFAVMWAASWFFPYMGQTSDVLHLATPYYRILIWSFLPFIVFFTFKQFAEGIGDTKYAMIITLLANVVNVVINYILIFGKWGAPAMGLAGAGYGTFASRLFMCIVILWLFFRKPFFSVYFKWARSCKPSWNKLKQLINVGVPIGLQMLLEVIAFAMSGIMMGWIGEVPLAAHQIAISLVSITFMIVTGIGAGTTIRVAHQYSHKRWEDMTKAGKASIHMVLFFMGVSALLFAVFRFQLPLLFTRDPEVIQLAALLLTFAAIFQIFDGAQVVLLSILRGIADVKHAMLYAFIAYTLINIPLSYLLSFTWQWGPVGIWIGFVFGIGSASILYMHRLRTRLRQIERRTKEM